MQPTRWLKLFYFHGVEGRGVPVATRAFTAAAGGALPLIGELTENFLRLGQIVLGLA